MRVIKCCNQLASRVMLYESILFPFYHSIFNFIYSFISYIFHEIVFDMHFITRMLNK